jgi:alcohol dehydrogenase
VDATGSAEGFGAAVRMAQPRGTIVLKSTMHGMVPIDTAPVIVNEITLIGSRCGRFEPALHLLEHGLVNVEDMISGRMRLSEAPKAFARAAEKDCLKVLLGAD